MGLFAPRIEHEDGEAQVSLFRFASPASELIRAANSGPILKLLRRREVALPLDPTRPPSNGPVSPASFCAPRWWRRSGRWTKGIFSISKTPNTACAARKAGWRIAHVPEAKMVHFRGGSGPVKALQKAKKRMPGYLYASRSRFFFQAYGRGG
jgi:N-acetylglucosaminyl-diphospho-decaprenol L-rhamnosyltransferase